jgi:hypothetical protein
MHQATVAELLYHKFVYDHIHLVRVRFDAAYKVGLALIDLFDKFVQRVLQEKLNTLKSRLLIQMNIDY